MIHLDRQPRTSRRREAQTGSRARSERTLDAVEHSRTLMEWWPFLIFHRGGLRIKVINNNATLQTLRSFARLDNAELGHSDLSADLDGVLELIPRETIGRTRVERDYGELPRIECFPRRLNQVFITLLTNAFDAIEDDGAVRVTTRNENGGVAIEIQDSGRGLSPDQLARIFGVHPMRRNADRNRLQPEVGARPSPGTPIRYRIGFPSNS